MSLQKRINKLSGASGLLLTIFACLVTLFTVNIYSHAFFTFWLFLLLLYYGLTKQAFIFLAIYAFVFFWLTEIVQYGVVFPSPMLFAMIYKLLLPMMAVFLTSNIPSGKTLATLRKIPMPQGVMLSLIVLARFAPTVSNEFKDVREAMRVRGFLGIDKVLQPLKILEYVVVPLIFRSITIADELAAASIVRGIENPVSKESYYNLSFSFEDFVVLSITFLIGIMAMLYKGSF